MATERRSTEVVLERHLEPPKLGYLVLLLVLVSHSATEVSRPQWSHLVKVKSCLLEPEWRPGMGVESLTAVGLVVGSCQLALRETARSVEASLDRW